MSEVERLLKQAKDMAENAVVMAESALKTVHDLQLEEVPVVKTNAIKWVCPACRHRNEQTYGDTRPYKVSCDDCDEEFRVNNR